MKQLFLPDDQPRFVLPSDKTKSLAITAILQNLALLAGVAWFFYQLATHPF